MRNRLTSRLIAALFCALMIAVLLPSAARAEEGGFRCEELSFPVTLAPGDATVYHVFGVLCARGAIEHKTVQITLHGITYSHLYWDFPFQPETYSYVRRATAEGYAVLNLDRIGIGQSDRPPAADVTIPSNGFVIHQIVQALRGGGLVVASFGRIAAGRVVLVGHSLGSAISIQEAATFGDVDGVVLTGLSHTVTPALGQLLGALYPASLDPRFAGQNVPDGYLTTLPGLRGVFYYQPSVDPLVIAIDEQTKETVTPTEIDTAFPALALSTGIHLPVLVVVGDFDASFCNPPTCSESGSIDAEPGFYPADACAEAVAMPDSGHDLNLEKHAQAAYDVILSWMDRRVGGDTRVTPSDPCQP
jgi:pimeloyl-ACP methyl ester carboxylesterase